MKLGVCIPYRDSGDGVRQGHLDRLIPHLEEFLGKQGIDFTCYIGHQNDDRKFHRSGTKNIAYLEAKKDGCDYFAFHDVDMLPIDVDYSYSDVPIHLANGFTNSDREIFDTYFGGVTMFPIDLFKKVNGYSNEYWGWGFEDDDLLLRCLENHIDLDGKNTSIKTKGRHDPCVGIRAVPIGEAMISILLADLFLINISPIVVAHPGKFELVFSIR